MTDQRLQVALGFAAEGCRVARIGNSKTARDTGWKKESTVDQDVIRGWWKEKPTNFCAVMDTLCVVEADCHEGKVDGRIELTALEEKYGKVETHRDRSGGGGLHLFFRVPAGAHIKTTKPFPGTESVEVLGENAAVILAGTFFPSGQTYTTLESAFHFANAPAWLLEACNGAAKTPVNYSKRWRKWFDEVFSGLKWRGDEADVPCPFHEDAVPSCSVNITKLVYLCHGCGATGTLAELKRKVSGELDQEEAHLTEDGLAHRLIEEHGEDVHYCWPLARWFVYDGKRWLLDDSGAIHHLARLTVRKLYAEASETEETNARKRLAQFALRAESRSKVEAMVALARSLPGVAVDREKFDADPFRLNCLNGTIDLRTGELLPHKREDLVTKISPVEYSPHAEAPVWRECLKTWLPITEVRDFVQVAIGYSASGSKSEECFFVLHGSGRNGKSKFLDAICYVLGDYSAVARPETFTKSRFDKIPEDVAALEGTRFAQTGEVEEGRAWATGILKSATGDEKAALRSMRQDTRQGVLSFKLWCATNTLPTVNEGNDAIWERIIPVPFEVYIRPEDRDKFLLQKLKSEAKGILAWIVEGAITWVSSGLQIPATLLEARKVYRADEDVLAEFLSASVEGCKDAVLNSRDLLRAYNAWCRDVDERPRYSKWIIARMKEKGFQPHAGNAGSKFFNDIHLILQEKL